MREVISPWLSAEEAAAYVRRTVKTIENWTSDGKIRVYKPDRRPLYKRSDLDAWIEKHAVAPTSKPEPVGAQ